MKDMRRFLSVAIVSLWGVTIILVLLMMLFGLINVDKGQDILKSFSSVTSGFVGDFVFLFHKL